MTSTLFLSDSITAFSPEGGDGTFVTADSLFGRKGKLLSGAAETLSGFEAEGEVVACLPPSWTTCQTLRVTASIGRQVHHSDMSDAIEAALNKAGGPGLAVVCAEPSVVLLDGKPVPHGPVGKPAREIEVRVTAFVSELNSLAALEKAADKAGLHLAGVMAMEEAASATLKPGTDERPPLVVADRWHTKIVGFASDAVAASSVVPIGAGHLASDLMVTFGMGEEEADALVRKALLGHLPPKGEDRLLVVRARLEELAASVAAAARAARMTLPPAMMLGLTSTPMVVEVFKAEGLEVRSPRGEIPRTDPPVLALATGALRLAEGAVPRSAATALQLATPKERKGPIAWLRRNF